RLRRLCWPRPTWRRSPCCSCWANPSPLMTHGVPSLQLGSWRGPHFLWVRDAGGGGLFHEVYGSYISFFFEWSKIGRTRSSLRQRPHHMARVLAESGFQVLLVEPPAGDGADVVNPKPLADGVFFVTPRRNSPATLRPWLEQLSEQFSDAPWIVHHPAWTPFLRDFLL